MPSSANIYSLIQPPQVVPYEAPEERQLRQMKLRQLLGAEEMQRLQLDEARRGIETGRSIQELISGRPDLQGDALINEVAKRDWKRAEEMRKAALEAKKTQAGIGKDEAETRSKNFKITRDMLPAVNDQAAYDVWREGVAQLLGPDQARALPAQFSPETRNALLMSADEWLKRNAPTIAEAETGRHNLATEAGTIRGQNMTAATAKERLTFDKSQADAGKWTNDLERGIQINSATGETRPMTSAGRPIGAKDKPLTESQARAQMFGTRAAESDSILTSLEDDINVWGLAAKQGAENAPLVGGPMGVLANSALSKDQQKVEQAQRNFINAVLRQESGAVISPSEFENARKQYFKQPGDSDEVVRQKRANRQSAIEGFRVGAGPAGERIERTRTPQESGGKIKSVPDQAPTRAEIDAELRRRGVIR